MKANNSIFLLIAATFLGWYVLLQWMPMMFTSDSSIYIDVARSLLNGHGLMSYSVDINPAGPDMTPLSLFPPGYSFLLYLFLLLEDQI